MPSRILLSDDDPVLRATLAEQLSHEGAHVVVVAANAQEALEAAQATPFALAIIGQDGTEGAALGKSLRDAGVACPILLLGDGAASEGGGFENLAKPFRFSALLARIHALTTHHAADGDAAVRIGPYSFHPSAKLLQAAGRKVRLTEKETNILKFLHASAGTVPREILLHEVWGYGPAVATHTLETHIYRLRKKIEADPGRAQILLTEGGGYRLSA
jgi:DNA-binding response OmpR family regulator